MVPFSWSVPVSEPTGTTDSFHSKHLTCHSRKSKGVINNNNNKGCTPLRSSVIKGATHWFYTWSSVYCSTCENCCLSSVLEEKMAVMVSSTCQYFTFNRCENDPSVTLYLSVMMQNNDDPLMSEISIFKMFCSL